MQKCSIPKENVEPTTMQSPKPYWDLTPEEWDKWAGEMMSKVRERNFSQNFPIVYVQGKTIVHEYNNGTILERVIDDSK